VVVSVLEKKYPEWHGFLMWHNARLDELGYRGRVKLELMKMARDFISKNV
jgi:hypothetical protein